MKNREIFELRTALEELSEIRGKSFAYAVFKNKEMLDKEVEIINQLKKDPHPDYINYENERQLLCIQFADKDEDNNPVLMYNPNGTQSYKIDEMEKFNEEYTNLSGKYESVLKDMEDSKKDFDEFLDKDSEVELKKVGINDLPDDITASFFDKIKYMID